ncbi:MAG: KpsF/GutQ family sugar-phosphate isomerase [Pelagibacterales bacterium]|nr:KpsF/GutQ family sugar-phosphate isomerase [Pelagibacterales bacterium]
MLQSDKINLIRADIRDQRTALSKLEKSIDISILKAVNLLFKNKGRIIITGIGKSGFIGLKLSATLSSTGSPSQYINCSEANHGDLGAIQNSDILLALSKSGDTKEMFPIISYAKRNKIKLISITAKNNSFLAKNSDIICLIPDIPESCPLNLAPTTSTTMMLVLGDAIALQLMNKRGFKKEHFKKFHPGGMLGKSLLLVKDIMHTEDKLPLIKNHNTMREALLKMTSYGFGCVGIINSKNHLIGIITDGDLRRNIAKKFLDLSIEKIMTKNPVTVKPKMNIKETIDIMNSNKITSVFVIKHNSKVPEGIIHIHDCIKIGEL